MLRSMTGFSCSQKEFSFGRLKIEISSFNNKKYLDIHTSLPKEFSAFELPIRKLISKFINRGNISIRIDLFLNPIYLLPDSTKLSDIKSYWTKILKDLNMDIKQLDIKFLENQLKHQSTSSFCLQEKDYKKDIQPFLESIIKDLIKMKLSEGANLQKIIEAQLLQLKKLTKKLEQKFNIFIKNFHKDLKDKFNKLEIDKNRIAQEISIYLEKLDVTEEIIRMQSHIIQIEELISSSKNISIGKKLDFLAQELIREVTTILSKSKSKEISNLTISIKFELDKIKQQVQNIE